MSDPNPTRIRFVGGPLDAQEHASKTVADAYRLAGGEYHVHPAADAGPLAVFHWRSDPPVRWHDGVVEPAATRV